MVYKKPFFLLGWQIKILTVFSKKAQYTRWSEVVGGSMGKKTRRVKTEAKTYRGPLDEILYNKNLWRKPIAKDGSCLFRAVSEQVS